MDLFSQIFAVEAQTASKGVEEALTFYSPFSIENNRNRRHFMVFDNGEKSRKCADFGSQ